MAIQKVKRRQTLTKGGYRRCVCFVFFVVFPLSVLTWASVCLCVSFPVHGLPFVSKKGKLSRERAGHWATHCTWYPWPRNPATQIQAIAMQFATSAVNCCQTELRTSELKSACSFSRSQCGDSSDSRFRESVIEEVRSLSIMPEAVIKRAGT